MRRGWMLLLGFVVVAYVTADYVLSTLTLRDYVTRPPTGFVREAAGPGGEPVTETLRIAVEDDFFGAQAEGTVRPAGGAALLLGHRHDFRTRSGDLVACRHIHRWMWCEDGWVPVRAGDPE